MQNLPPIRSAGMLTKSLYQLTLQSPDIKICIILPPLEAKVRNLPGLIDVPATCRVQNPQVNVEINRDKAAAWGSRPASRRRPLLRYGSRQISTIYAPTTNTTSLWSGSPVPGETPRPCSGSISAPARASYATGRGGQPDPKPGTLTINTRPAAGVTIPSTSSRARPWETQWMGGQAGPAECCRPPSHQLPGAAQAFQSSWQRLVLLLIMSILVIY